MKPSSSLATRCYSIEPRTRKYVKEYGFLSFSRNLTYKYEEKILNTDTKIGLDASKTTSKKVVHIAAETTGKFIAKKSLKKLLNQHLYRMKIQEMLKRLLFH